MVDFASHVLLGLEIKIHEEGSLLGQVRNNCLTNVNVSSCLNCEMSVVVP